MIIDKKHIILFWILGLILFTFYYIFRIKHIREKYDDISISTKPQTIIAHINNIQEHNKLTDMPGCGNVYDDNIKVQEIGYNDCQSAYVDYLHKNLNININMKVKIHWLKYVLFLLKVKNIVNV